MKKLYLDTTQAQMCISVYVKDTEVVPAGTPVNVMPVGHQNNEYRRFAEQYDIQFIFADNIPKVDFYSVPMVDIFAIDSHGGYFGSVGQPTDFEAEIPICYIDAKKRCYLIATTGRDFLSRVDHWQKCLMPCTDIELFESFEAAQQKYEFLNRAATEQELKISK